MKLSILIVSYNGAEHLRRCLKSIADEVTSNVNYEVILHDNASTEPVVEMVRDEFPWVRVFEGKNKGFSYGNNRALECSNDPEYTLLLNPDVIVSSGVISFLVSKMDGDASIGASTVMNVGEDGKFQFSITHFPNPLWSLCDAVGLGGIDRRLRIGRYLKSKHPVDVEGLCGAFIMVRMSCLEGGGLLDEDYFMYYEDHQLSLNIIKRGFRNVLFPEWSIIHVGGGSTSSSNFRKYNAAKSLDVYIKKNCGVFSGQLIRIFSFLYYLRKNILSPRGEHYKMLRAYWGVNHIEL